MLICAGASLYSQCLLCPARCDAEAEAGDEAVALSPPQWGWEMLLKMEFSSVLSLPFAAASRLSSLFILPASPAVALPPQRTTLHNIGAHFKERIENASQMNVKDGEWCS